MNRISEWLKLIFVIGVMSTFVCIIGTMYVGVMMIGYVGYNLKKLRKRLKI